MVMIVIHVLIFTEFVISVGPGLTTAFKGMRDKD
jgi:hypothetical protein